VVTFDVPALNERLRELEEELNKPDLWSDQQRAARLSTEHSRIQKKLQRFQTLQGNVRFLEEGIGAFEEDELLPVLAETRAELERLQEDALFSGEYDTGDAVVTIQSDAGGTDAQDFTEMLLRTYLRWAEKRGFETELLEASPGEEAGLKSATFTVEGENAYGVLKAERGKHRLVRLSPFDQAHRRHTSFAQVIPAPLLSEDGEIEIDENDLRVDTYRASGAGGQHVNKTDSAVRITHLPTAVLEQADGAPHPPLTPRREGRGGAGGGAGAGAWRSEHGLRRERHPQLRPPSLPARQGSPDGLRGRERAGRPRRRPRRVNPGVVVGESCWKGCVSRRFR